MITVVHSSYIIQQIRKYMSGPIILMGGLVRFLNNVSRCQTCKPARRFETIPPVERREQKYCWLIHSCQVNASQEPTKLIACPECMFFLSLSPS